MADKRLWSRLIVCRPVRRGGLLGSYEPPPVPTYGKQKLEPNHFVAVPDLFERSELEVSLTLVLHSQTAFTRKAVWLRETNLNILKLRTVLHFVMTSLDDYDLAATMKRQQASN